MADQIEELKARVNKLENSAWLAGTLAVIFGIGGAFGQSALSAAKTRITELEQSAGKLEKARDERVAEINTSAKGLVDKLAKAEFERLVVSERAERKREVALVKKWTLAVYDIATTPSYEPGAWASQFWQRKIMDEKPNAHRDLD